MCSRVYLSAIASGLLLWTAFFPLDLGPISFVALVPWLTLVRAPVGNRKRYFAAYVGGLTFFLVAVQWMRVAHPMMVYAWLFLAFVYPLTWVLGLWIIRRIDAIGRIPLAVSVPLVWVALEFTRAHFPTGFPFMASIGMYQMIGFGWYFLGYSLHGYLPLIQTADFGGVYAVSFVVASVNGLVAEWVMRLEPARGWLRWSNDVHRATMRRMVPASIWTAALVIGTVVYGVMKLDHEPYAEGPHVALLQGSVDQDVKNTKGSQLGDTYYGLYKQSVSGDAKPDLVVWPETCGPYIWFQPNDDDTVGNWDWSKVTPEFRRAANANLGGMLQEHLPVTTLYGQTGIVWDGEKPVKYNSAVAISPRREFLGRYDKIHLVPLGEYVPLRETLPFIARFTPYEDDYSCKPGESWKKFPLACADGRAFTFGCLICYEDSDPYMARQYATPDKPVDFLVNISNDGWFRGTEEHEEHLAICQFRAIETRRSVVRAVNMGISGVIDPDGRVITSLAKQTEGVIHAAVPIDTRQSWYARTGDWLPGLSWVLIALGLLLARRKGRAAV
jgi:apolipoprotein N-acyltransferase